MDTAQEALMQTFLAYPVPGFNPNFHGYRSGSEMKTPKGTQGKNVSILIFMDTAQEETPKQSFSRA